MKKTPLNCIDSIKHFANKGKCIDMECSKCYFTLSRECRHSNLDMLEKESKRLLLQLKMELL
jgi:hypothetical protein